VHAEAEASRVLSGASLLEQTLVRQLVARAQKTAALRERTRAWVTRALGMLRSAALDADRRLRRRNPDLAGLVGLGHPHIPWPVGPVFFLTLDEVIHALATGRSDLGPLVRARRAQVLRDLSRPDPPPTFVGAPPPVILPPLGGAVLRGLPASGGVVEGPVRVVHGPEQMDRLQPGEVLVVQATDVGWTPLFVSAAGVVTELGGPLSHAAIVARELGVPTVVSVPGATRTLRDGERVRIDGNRGVVERLGP
jgi:pyruvate,water dikinase